MASDELNLQKQSERTLRARNLSHLGKYSAQLLPIIADFLCAVGTSLPLILFLSLSFSRWTRCNPEYISLSLFIKIGMQ